MTEAVGKLLLFGATGDLSQRMLIPSLYGLHADSLLPVSVGSKAVVILMAAFLGKARLIDNRVVSLHQQVR